MTNLAQRLEDLPGVAGVELDIDDLETGGIRVRLEENADEAEVMERVRALLVAYGVRSPSDPPVKVGRMVGDEAQRDLGVEVRITPIKGGARIEVFGKKVRSFRIVPPTPSAVAQGVSDAWCQVAGRIPLEIVDVHLTSRRELAIVASNGNGEHIGRCGLEHGWAHALTSAVGQVLGVIEPDPGPNDVKLASAGW